MYAAAFTTLGHEMYVAPEKADGTIGFGRDITDVSGPAQVITDGDSQVLAVCCYFKFMVMQHFNCIQLFFAF